MNPDSPRDDFYRHYAPMPKSYRRFLLVLIPILFLGILAIAAFLPNIHSQLNTGKIQGRQTFEGLLVAEPVPHIIVPRPGNTENGDGFSRYVLSAGNKAGVSQKVLDLAGQWVSMKGLVVSRNQYSMVVGPTAEAIATPEGVTIVNPTDSTDNTSPSEPEPTEAIASPEDVESDSTDATSPSDDSEPAEAIETPKSITIDPTAGISLGEFELEGEILDGKCYPGVMKPGRGKVHRACAIRCISGGIPAVFIVQNDRGESLYFLLEDTEGKAVNDRVLPLVGDRIKISGEVMQYDDMLVVKADPDTYARM
ncbi:MAG: hypothetical protein ACFB9N_17130 [Geitlerinemataceae cyanobacterium]